MAIRLMEKIHRLGCPNVGDTVDGSEILHPSIGSSSHYLQGFIHPRWLFGISSINSTTSIKTFWGSPKWCRRFSMSNWDYN